MGHLDMLPMTPAIWRASDDHLDTPRVAGLLEPPAGLGDMVVRTGVILNRD
jgi:hypothetical protein